MKASKAKAIVLVVALGCLVFIESCNRLAACHYPTTYLYWFLCTTSTDTIEIKGGVYNLSGKDVIRDSINNLQMSGYQIETRWDFQEAEFCSTVRGKKCVEEAEADGATCHYYLTYTAGCNSTNGGSGSISCE